MRGVSPSQKRAVRLFGDTSASGFAATYANTSAVQKHACCEHEHEHDATALARSRLVPKAPSS
jgi:hypothetical protein